MDETSQSFQKFTFDTEFKGRKVYISDEARARQRFSLTQAEMEKLKADGRAEGLQSAEAKAAEHTARAIEQLASALSDQLSSYSNMVEDIRDEAFEFSFAAARKLAGAALETCPEDIVEEALRQAAHQAVREPKMILRASAQVIEAIRERAGTVVQEEGFDGRLELVADRSVKGADCRIEWEGGGLDQCMAIVEKAVAEILSRHRSASEKDAG